MAIQQITYGGVVLPYTTLDVTSRPVFASDGIQQIGTAYDFNVSGIISAATPDAFATLVDVLRVTLSTRALDFVVQQVWSGGTTTLFSFTSQHDDMWGPHPGVLKINRISGGIAATYSWNVSAMSKECLGTSNSLSSPATLIKAITTSYTHAVDRNGYVTRVVSGTLTTTAFAASKNQNADSFRAMCTPPLPKYFQRTHQEFSMSEDRRELKFNIVDVEQEFTLPEFITGGDAQFSVRLAATGLVCEFTLSGNYEAPADVDKTIIVTAIFNLLTSKIQPYLAEGAKNPAFITEQQITSHIYKNRVDFSFRGMFVIGTKQTTTPTAADITILFQSVAKTILAPDPASTGTAQLIREYGGNQGGTNQRPDVIAQLATQYDSCPTKPNSGTYQPVPPPELPPKSDSSDKTDKSQPTKQEPDPGSPNVSAAHLAAPFILYHEEWHYDLDNGYVIFDAKSSNDDIPQQVRAPKLTITQGGYYVRYALSDADIDTIGNNDALLGCTVPPPMFGMEGSSDALAPNKNGVLLSSSIQPSAPQPMGDGTYSQYTLHWRYVYRTTHRLKDHKLVPFLKWPVDPRRKAVQQPSADSEINMTAAGMSLVQPGNASNVKKPLQSLPSVLPTP